jgi:hypothetical protein
VLQLSDVVGLPPYIRICNISWLRVNCTPDDGHIGARNLIEAIKPHTLSQLVGSLPLLCLRCAVT